MHHLVRALHLRRRLTRPDAHHIASVIPRETSIVFTDTMRVSLNVCHKTHTRTPLHMINNSRLRNQTSRDGPAESRGGRCHVATAATTGGYRRLRASSHVTASNPSMARSHTHSHATNDHNHATTHSSVQRTSQLWDVLCQCDFSV